MTLLDECIESLGEDSNILTNDEKSKILNIFEGSFSLTEWGRIDWDQISKREKVNTVNDIFAFLERHYENLKTKIYIIWDAVTLPIIQSDLKKVFSVIDDVTAVSFDTWIFSPELGYVVEIYHEGEVIVGINKKP
ncbi:hypothetical protein [Thermoactinomyces sp. CICC 10522]|uniref:CDI toxin immunity protein n=1 Tax=Thermoactinomyces sp. CICC 10522 TaxID=2767427 RepID=UPI0018DD16A4|nr:hypothetical protein [Thermoactinomyces sp. CICC 10522]MBH8605210.1 hypothetical protein [Thermoactinomyces sp. CICC 10522]